MSAFTDLGDRLVGAWTAESTHPLLPGEVITGTADFAWLDGDAFLVTRSHSDHPDIPDAVSIMGADEHHYFDSRGVRRVYAVTITDDGWAIEMPKPDDGDFAQRISYRVGDDRIDGLCQLGYTPGTWQDDLEVTFRRT